MEFVVPEWVPQLAPPLELVEKVPQRTPNPLPTWMCQFPPNPSTILIPRIPMMLIEWSLLLHTLKPSVRLFVYTYLIHPSPPLIPHLIIIHKSKFLNRHRRYTQCFPKEKGVSEFARLLFPLFLGLIVHAVIWVVFSCVALLCYSNTAMSKWLFVCASWGPHKRLFMPSCHRNSTMSTHSSIRLSVLPPCVLLNLSNILSLSARLFQSTISQCPLQRTRKRAALFTLFYRIYVFEGDFPLFGAASQTGYH